MLKRKFIVNNDDDIKKLSFEDALAKLENIVRGLETGQIKLEDALSSYEMGNKLRLHCEEKLAQAKSRIDKITIDKNGSLSLDPFEINGAKE